MPAQTPICQGIQSSPQTKLDEVLTWSSIESASRTVWIVYACGHYCWCMRYLSRCAVLEVIFCYADITVLCKCALSGGLPAFVAQPLDPSFTSLYYGLSQQKVPAGNDGHTKCAYTRTTYLYDYGMSVLHFHAYSK